MQQNLQNQIPAVYFQSQIPDNINGLINGINNQNLNYGNNNILDLEKRMSKQDITAGLQKGLNFGIPQIAQMQQSNPYKMVNNLTQPNNVATNNATNGYEEQPIVGIDISQQDYNNAQKQGLLPNQLGLTNPNTPDPNTPIIQTGASEHRPALFRGMQDLANGFQENAQNPFKVSNLEDTKTADGQDKGFLYRLGEGAGTLGRVANSSGGRGLMTGLLIAGMGGNPSQAVTYGLQAGLGNYNNVQQDKVNRGLLQANGIDTSNMRGYLNNDMAKSYTDNYYKLNGAQYRNNRLSLDNYNKLRTYYDTQFKNGQLKPDAYTELVDNLNNKFENSNIETGGAGNVQASNQTNLSNAGVDLIKAKTKTEGMRPELIQNQISTNNARIKILAQRAARGDSPAKQELQSLNIQNKKLMIQQNQMINKTLSGGGTSPVNRDPLGILDN